MNDSRAYKQPGERILRIEVAADDTLIREKKFSYSTVLFTPPLSLGYCVCAVLLRTYSLDNRSVTEDNNKYEWAKSPEPSHTHPTHPPVNSWP